MNLKQIKSLQERKQASHKGENGFVLVVGGSQDYTGTLILVGLSALRSGCDLVTITAPEKVAWAINAYSPDLITTKLKGDYLSLKHYSKIKKYFKNHNVIELGNGLTLKDSSVRLCKKIVKEQKEKLKVIDADAIKCLSLREIDNAIITPHSKELELLLKNSNLKEINSIKNKFKKAKALQKHLKNNVLLLKGPIDYIASSKKIEKVRGGNPGLTKGGTGDVLAGLCAGFLSQSEDLFKSALAASTLTKKIGDILLKKKKGFTFLASDMAEEIKRLKKNNLS